MEGYQNTYENEYLVLPIFLINIYFPFSPSLHFIAQNTLKIESNKCSIAIDENKIIDSEKNNTISLDDNEISLATKVSPSISIIFSAILPHDSLVTPIATFYLAIVFIMYYHSLPARLKRSVYG